MSSKLESLGSAEGEKRNQKKFETSEPKTEEGVAESEYSNNGVVRFFGRQGFLQLKNFERRIWKNPRFDKHRPKKQSSGRRSTSNSKPTNPSSTEDPADLDSAI